jgi:hypothetical protein
MYIIYKCSCDHVTKIVGSPPTSELYTPASKRLTVPMTLNKEKRVGRRNINGRTKLFEDNGCKIDGIESRSFSNKLLCPEDGSSLIL